MSFLSTIPEDEAKGLVQNQYTTDLKEMGYVANYTQAFSLRPEVYNVWGKLIGTIRSKMSLRLYELVTFSSAMALKCEYSMLAHGRVLRKKFFDVNEMIAIITDFRDAGLSPAEVAAMSFAQKITMQSYRINAKDIDELRGHGFSDEEILDMIHACAARNFFAKILSATGTKPDNVYLELEPELFQLLTGNH